MSTAQATAAPRTAAPPALVRGYTWEVPVRLTHWLIALSIVVLSVTGFYIGRPFVAVPGEAGAHFVMGTMKAIHFYTAIVFTLSVLSRIVWMFVGNRYARWHQFALVSPERFRELLRVVRFYLFIDRQAPRSEGHNPLAGVAYSMVFVLYLLEIATGLALYSVSAHVDSPMRAFGFLLPLVGGTQTARWIHHVIMWLLLAFAVHHVYSAWLVTILEKDATIDSMFSGYKVRPVEPEQETES